MATTSTATAPNAHTQNHLDTKPGGSKAAPSAGARQDGGPPGPPPVGPVPPTPAKQINGASKSPAPASTHATATPGGGSTAQNTPGKGKKKPDPPDVMAMYESVKSRIAALESEEVHGEEEEKKITEEARNSIKDQTESAIQQKYIELFAEMKRLEREHAKERQKLTKDKDAAKSQLTKANQGRTKLENLARELQKDNRKLRDDGKRLAGSIEEVQEELAHMKTQVERRTAALMRRRDPSRLAPNGQAPSDLVVKVVCKYRAELFFKISRKTKLSRLFSAWTDRMASAEEATLSQQEKGKGPVVTSVDGKEAKGKKREPPPMTFLFTHVGRSLEPDTTPDEAGMEDGDEILAVELMDLTGPEVEKELPDGKRVLLQKNWTDSPAEARKAVEELFDGMVRERLKDVLRQYELREKHFDCVIRSKELEVLLAQARVDESRHAADGERRIATVAETQNQQLRLQMEEMQNSQARLMDKLITCCKEPTGERTQKLFAFLREELERRGTKVLDMMPPATPDLSGVD
ncbi:hypothetical protein DACRYDRAFT_21745 [Dacryopinax primogenitus]|uniref:Ubiquitin-like domain-containing protein n=1 Tax=Dacryopinax primogenitus (strain DJM 731) TaxID=1858805 RepID=M5G267_DACPD|nr:uncharacterized protein DACRYDRAFT_21745 [Dacryopinax primogenitus]EJU02784.1 hypothetical protein DACRYDRAFT_21745 [Dacryopinax primogenitus]